MVVTTVAIYALRPFSTTDTDRGHRSSLTPSLAPHSSGADAKSSLGKLAGMRSYSPGPPSKHCNASTGQGSALGLPKEENMRSFLFFLKELEKVISIWTFPVGAQGIPQRDVCFALGRRKLPCTKEMCLIAALGPGAEKVLSNLLAVCLSLELLKDSSCGFPRSLDLSTRLSFAVLQL